MSNRRVLLFLGWAFVTTPVLAGEAAETREKVAIEFIQSNKDIPARTVYIRLNAAQTAELYELQIRPQDKTWESPYQLQTKEDQIRFRVTPGYYEIRTRAVQNQKQSLWSEWKKFSVPFPKPSVIFPADGAKIISKSNLEEQLNFQWPQVPGAHFYRIKLYDESGTLIRHAVTSNNWLMVNLKSNSKYSWSLKPLLSDKDPEEDDVGLRKSIALSEPTRDLILVSLTLAPKSRAEKYQFELLQTSDEKNEASIYESTGPIFKAHLVPAEYEVRVRSVHSDGTYSAWSPPRLFSLPLPSPQILNYEKQVEATDDVKSRVSLAWEPLGRADRYLVTIEDEDGGVILSETVKGNKIDVNVPAGRTYRWRLKGLLKNQSVRNISSLTDQEDKFQTFQVGDYVKLSLSAAEEPSQLFVWGRSIISNAKYNATNYDNDTLIHQDVLATAGELALGYWHRKSSFGGLVTASLSGIRVAEIKSTHNGAALLLGYRKIYEGQRRLRFWLGMGYRDLPEIQVDPNSSINIRKISSYGPQALLAYHDSLGGPWGFQFHMGGYYGMQSLQTPNNLAHEKDSSFMLSLFSTYRVRQNLLGLLGYTYQFDESGYRSDDRSGNSNHFQYQGHYLSLSLIWGLQEPQK